MAAAAERMGPRIGAKRELDALEQYLHDGEQVTALAGNHGPGSGPLVLTSDRILFLFEGLVRNDFVDFPWTG